MITSIISQRINQSIIYFSIFFTSRVNYEYRELKPQLTWLTKIQLKNLAIAAHFLIKTVADIFNLSI